MFNNVIQVTAGLGYFCFQVVLLIMKIVTPALTGSAFLKGPYSGIVYWRINV